MPKPGTLAAGPVALLLAFAGCRSNDITLHDHGLPMPSLRFAVHSFELEATGGKGEAAGGAVDYSLADAQFLLRYPLPTGKWIGITPLFGVEALRVGLDDPARPALDGFSSVGFAGGLDVRRETFSQLWLYGRGTAAWLFEPATSVRGEFGVSYVTDSQLELFAGYRWWRVRQEGIDLGLSSAQDVGLDTEGVVIGVGLRF